MDSEGKDLLLSGVKWLGNFTIGLFTKTTPKPVFAKAASFTWKNIDDLYRNLPEKEKESSCFEMHREKLTKQPRDAERR